MKRGWREDVEEVGEKESRRKTSKGRKLRGEEEEEDLCVFRAVMSEGQTSGESAHLLHLQSLRLSASS